MGFRLNVKWLLVGIALSVVLTFVVRALTGIWFLGFFLFLPFGLSIGSKRLGTPYVPLVSSASEPFSATPLTQDELRNTGGAAGTDQTS